MATFCKEEQERVEEEVLQPVDRFVQQQQKRCENEPCNWWMLCLNKLVCWLVWVTLKIVEWVLIIVVRWVYRIVCVVVRLIIGVVVFIFNPNILFDALLDVWELIKDTFYSVVGFVLFYGSTLIDLVLTTIGVQSKKRGLTEKERAVLRPIYGDSLLYDAIRIIEGNVGIYGPPFYSKPGATTIGFNIYFRSTPNMATIVHESVHVWQFQFDGTRYIGQSAIQQTLFQWGLIGDPYKWDAMIGTGANAWYLLESVEAQAEFIENVFSLGRFIFDKAGTVPDESEGAFFNENDDGHNEFLFSRDANGDGIGSGTDYTDIANHAWMILKTG